MPFDPTRRNAIVAQQFLIIKTYIEANNVEQADDELKYLNEILKKSGFDFINPTPLSNNSDLQQILLLAFQHKQFEFLENFFDFLKQYELASFLLIQVFKNPANGNFVSNFINNDLILACLKKEKIPLDLIITFLINQNNIEKATQLLKDGKLDGSLLNNDHVFHQEFISAIRKLKENINFVDTIYKKLPSEKQKLLLKKFDVQSLEGLLEKKITNPAPQSRKNQNEEETPYNNIPDELLRGSKESIHYHNIPAALTNNNNDSGLHQPQISTELPESPQKTHDNSSKSETESISPQQARFNQRLACRIKIMQLLLEENEQGLAQYEIKNIHKDLQIDHSLTLAKSTFTPKNANLQILINTAIKLKTSNFIQELFTCLNAITRTLSIERKISYLNIFLDGKLADGPDAKPCWSLFFDKPELLNFLNQLATESPEKPPVFFDVAIISLINEKKFDQAFDLLDKKKVKLCGDFLNPTHEYHQEFKLAIITLAKTAKPEEKNNKNFRIIRRILDALNQNQRLELFSLALDAKNHQLMHLVVMHGEDEDCKKILGRIQKNERGQFIDSQLARQIEGQTPSEVATKLGKTFTVKALKDAINQENYQDLKKDSRAIASLSPEGVKHKTRTMRSSPSVSTSSIIKTLEKEKDTIKGKILEDLVGFCKTYTISNFDIIDAKNKELQGEIVHLINFYGEEHIQTFIDILLAVLEQKFELIPKLEESKIKILNEKLLFKPQEQTSFIKLFLNIIMQKLGNISPSHLLELKNYIDTKWRMTDLDTLRRNTTSQFDTITNGIVEKKFKMITEDELSLYSDNNNNKPDSEKHRKFTDILILCLQLNFAKTATEYLAKMRSLSDKNKIELSQGLTQATKELNTRNPEQDHPIPEFRTTNKEVRLFNTALTQPCSNLMYASFIPLKEQHTVTASPQRNQEMTQYGSLIDHEEQTPQIEDNSRETPDFLSDIVTVCFIDPTQIARLFEQLKSPIYSKYANHLAGVLLRIYNILRETNLQTAGKFYENVQKALNSSENQVTFSSFFSAAEKPGPKESSGDERRGSTISLN